MSRLPGVVRSPSGTVSAVTTGEQTEATPARVKGPRFWRRIVPKSILGLASLMFFMSVASAFSGAVLFAYYQFELDDTQDRIEDVESRIKDDLEAAQQILDVEREDAINQIEQELSALDQFALSGASLEDLLASVIPSVFFVQTLDENGQPSVGTAFVFESDSETSLLITSYSTIQAATREPAPNITVSHGAEAIPVELRTWDPATDLALLIAPIANLPELPRASMSTVNVGDRIFAFSGFGSAGGAVTQGVVADISTAAITHDAGVGAQWRGGPMLNSSGELVGIASLNYAPFGFAPRNVTFGIPWPSVCSVIDCPDNIEG